MTRRLESLAAVGLLASLAACGATTAPSESSATEAAPLHAVPVNPVVVSGTATCNLSTTAGVGADGEPGFLAVCELDMSDPRVSGTETEDRFRQFPGGEAGDVWVAEEATITNANGTWRGSSQMADDGIASGEAHLVGEGAYEGLEFHYYFGGWDRADVAKVRGWISGGR